MEKNIPNVKKSYKILNILKPYIQEEMKHRLDYPETENLTKQECIEELNQLFRGYRFDSSYRSFIIKETRELWTEMRTVGYTGRVMLRLGKLVF
jgi:spermidine/putrescine-binding protein